MKKADKCQKIYEIIKESLTPDKRSFEEAEMSAHIESIFENTYRIHGKSEALDWIKIASIKSARFLTERGYKTE